MTKAQTKQEKISIGTIVFWAVILLAIVMMVFTIVVLKTVDSQNRSLFGYRSYVVLTDSMSATDFDAGDLIICKWVDPATLEEGDIISFQSRDTDRYGEVVTHKIRSRTVDENGNAGFITYGTTTNTNDDEIVTYSTILGKYLFSLPNLGSVLTFLKTPAGYFIIVFIPFVLLIGYQTIKLVGQYREYQRMKKQALEARRRKLLLERKKAQMMQRELQQMRSQMGTGSASAASADALTPEQRQALARRRAQMAAQQSAPQNAQPAQKQLTPEQMQKLRALQAQRAAQQAARQSKEPRE